MDMSPEGLSELIKREGVKFKAYRDVAGVWTICVGHTSAAGPPRVTPHMTADLAECMDILKHDVAKFEDCVESKLKVPVTQNEFDALVSLAFNIGCGGFHKSSVLKYLNKGDKATAADKFRLWNKGRVKGKLQVIKGLVNRREEERDQFLGRATA